MYSCISLARSSCFGAPERRRTSGEIYSPKEGPAAIVFLKTSLK